MRPGDDAQSARDMAQLLIGQQTGEVFTDAAQVGSGGGRTRVGGA